MIHILVVSHCSLAHSLLATGKMICGDQLIEGIDAITVEENESGIKIFEQKVEAFYKKFVGDSFLILADIACATPFNVCMSVFHDAKFTILSGVNLPMIIEASLNKDKMSLTQLSLLVKETGQKSVDSYSFESICESSCNEDDIL